MGSDKLTLLQFTNSRRTPGTQRQYRQSVCLFFECLSGRPYTGQSRSAEHLNEMDRMSSEYISTDQNYFSDLLRFASFVADSFSPNTMNTHLSVVIMWLELNDIVISKRKLEAIKGSIEKRRVITKDHILTHEEIKKWYEHLTRIGRVALVIQMATGMRLGEVLGLLPEDVDLENRIVYVRRSNQKRKTTKNQKERITFLTEEALFILNEWLAYRDTFLEIACKKSNTVRPKTRDDARLVPVTNSNIQEVYTRALEKAGLLVRDPDTHRATITSHSIRRYFISQLKTAMPAEMVEALAGHEGYLSGAYRRYSVEQLQAEYDKACHLVSLSSPENLPAIKADLQSQAEFSRSLASENMRLQQQLQSEMREREEQARRISAIEAAMSKR
ncbi:tyrosine-type recombinase/integrase [Methanospirillum stamsii]|uniref:Tyr recombinase domain-containing protein n=1 Tax=Methanospirillum stamsii TaxID=1277351 RepID=A0A2V2N3Y3_9EURY|nr:tyrosine-type recombinase/integrase [Methanospirillum stamsii]PWR74854.1 hypothetical protein DLD82_08125 [Methanospirillum stamsii]